MALQKSYEDDQGFTCDYHRVKRVEIDHDSQSVIIVVWVYKDAAARAANKRPLVYTCHVDDEGIGYGSHFNQAAMDPLGCNDRERAYEWLKAHCNSGWMPQPPVDYTAGTTDV